MSDWFEVDFDNMPDTSHDPMLLWNGRYLQLGVCLSDVKCNFARSFYNLREDTKLRGITHYSLIELPWGAKPYV